MRYRLKTYSATVRLVLNLLALGVDASAIEETVNTRESTLRTWLCRGDQQGRKLHQRFLANFDLVHIQLDELHPALRALAVWANVRQAQEDVWLWTACDCQNQTDSHSSTRDTHSRHGLFCDS